MFPEYPKNAATFVSDPFGCTAESLKKAKELLGDKYSVYFQYYPDSNVWTYIDENGIEYWIRKEDYLNNRADDNQVEDNQADDNDKANSIIEELEDRLN